MISVHVKGDKALLDMVKNLPGSFGRDIQVSALKAGARKIQQQAKRDVPVNTGELKKSFVVQETVSSRLAGKRDITIPAEVVVGVKSPVSRRLHLVEFGHKLQNGGFFMGTRFFTRAVESTESQVYATISRKMRLGFDKVTKRLSRRFRDLSRADRRKLLR